MLPQVDKVINHHSSHARLKLHKSSGWRPHYHHITHHLTFLILGGKDGKEKRKRAREKKKKKRKQNKTPIPFRCLMVLTYLPR